MNWLKGLFGELMEMILDKEDISNITEENLPNERFRKFIQLSLDIHFLLEIAKWGGYLSDTVMNAYSDYESCTKSAFLSAGMDPERRMSYTGWATRTATETLQKLHELDKREILSNEIIDATEEETNESNSHNSTESFGSDDATNSVEVLRRLDAPEVTSCTRGSLTDMEKVPCHAQEEQPTV